MVKVLLMTSFASVIDATYKNNIRVSCEFADCKERGERFLPYGAIFAFRLREDEVEKVVNTGVGSEVGNGGVDGVSFRENPERLFGI